MSARPFRVVALIAAFNEADVLEHVLDDLHRQGVEVYFIDDGSTDRTAAIAEARVGRGVIAVERSGAPTDRPTGDAQFQWTGILRRKEQLAAEIDADWFIHCDADEFRETPWPGMSLADGIARVDRAGCNAIDFALFDFPPTDEGFVPGTDVRNSLRYCEPGRTWNVQQVKCWKKTGGAVDLTSSGGHDVQFPGRRIYPLRFVLRHYPIRGSAHGQQKVFAERLPRFSEAERARGWHVQYSNISNGPFVRDAASLRSYDAAAVRAEVATTDIERIEAERARLAVECVGLREELAVERTSERALREELAAARTSERALREELVAERAGERALREELAAARTSERALLERSNEFEQRLGAHRAEQLHLLAEIQAIYQSASWKMTAPFRALVRPLISKPRRY